MYITSIIRKLEKIIVEQLIVFCTRSPKKVLLVNLAFLLPMMAGLFYFSEDYDVRIWFRTDDPHVQRLDQFEKQFGSDEAIITLVHHPEGIFRPETMHTMEKLTRELWLLPSVVTVESIVNHMDSQAIADELVVAPFIDQRLIDDPSYLQARKVRASQHPIVRNYLVNAKGDTAMLIARLRPRLGGEVPDYPKIDLAHRALVDGMRQKLSADDQTQIFITGSAAINNTFREVGRKDLQLMIPLLVLMMVITMYYYFRSWGPIILPGIMITLSVLATAGLMGWWGFKFNNLLSAIPGLLISVCLAGAIHIIVYFYQGRASGLSAEKAMSISISKNFRATFFTSVTTAVGFWALNTATLNPIKHLGILCGAGTMIAWVLTFSFIVPALLIWPMKINPKHREEDFTAAGPAELKKVMSIYRWRWPIVGVYFLATALAVWAALKVETNSNPFRYFRENNRLYQANEFQLKNYGGSGGPEIVLDSGTADGIHNPQFLAKVEKLNQWLLDSPGILKTVSVLDIIKKVNMSLHGEDPQHAIVPDSSPAVAQLLFLYTMGLPQGKDLNDRMSLDKKAMRITVLWSIQDSKTYVSRVQEINQKIEQLGLNGEVNGKMALYQTMNGYVVDTLINSSWNSLWQITLCLILMFGSIGLGILAMIPNIMPMPFILAFMSWWNIPLDLGTALVVSICLGIAVDDTIHLINTFVNNREAGLSVEENLGSLMKSTAPALALTTVNLVLGFGSFVVGDFIPNVRFGALTAIGLSFALSFDLLFIPAIILIAKRFLAPIHQSSSAESLGPLNPSSIESAASLPADQ